MKRNGHTSWISPNERYEAAVLQFVDDILDRRRPFLQAFQPFQARVAELGVYNSLAQLLIKITAPGVPDFYQGTELWDLSLVDPDNRRPVDYEHRRPGPARTLQGAVTRATLLDARADGRVKMFVMVRALAERTALRDVYDRGSYVPLAVEGAQRSHVFAFARRHRDTSAITCVPRLVAGLLGSALRRRRSARRSGATRASCCPGRRRGRRNCATRSPAFRVAGARRRRCRLARTPPTVFDQFPARPARSCRLTAAMEYLTYIGGAFIVWFVLVLLFAPHIPYHSTRPIDRCQRPLRQVIESTCQGAYKRRQPDRRFSPTAPAFYPAMLDAIRQARETVNMECLHVQEGRGRRPVRRGARRTRAGRRARHAGHGRGRQPRALPEHRRTRCGRQAAASSRISA